MEKLHRESWARAINGSLSEFLSHASEARQHHLEKLLREYRQAVERGEVSLYRPSAA